jgi:hypothetical protein
MRLHPAWPVALAFAATAPTQPAAAYRTAADFPDFEGQARVRWESLEVPYVISTNVIPNGLTSHALVDEARAAMSRWQTAECTSLRWAYHGSSSSSPSYGDGGNGVGWLTGGWSTRGFDPAVAGVTDLRYVLGEDGQWRIAEADAYFNAQAYQWVLDDDGSDPDIRAVNAVVAHEAGHMVGMAHPCEPDGTDGAPLCGEGGAYAETTMYPAYYGSDQATLSQDDLDGVCFLYPLSECTPDVCTACGEAYCGLGYQCIEDECVPSEGGGTPPPVGDGLLGDPCATGQDCRSGLCAAEGYCTTVCSHLGNCPDGYACGDDGLCVAIDDVFGAPCAEGADCASGLCLLPATGRPFCTRTCFPTDATPCPDGLLCDEVDGRHVCAPPLPATGCAVGTPVPAGTGATLLAILATLAVIRRWRSS